MQAGALSLQFTITPGQQFYFEKLPCQTFNNLYKFYTEITNKCSQLLFPAP